MIKLLKPRPVAKPHLPRCEAVRETVYYNDTPETDRQCSRAAVVQIGRHELCMQHAGPLAVDYLIAKQRKKNWFTSVPTIDGAYWFKKDKECAEAEIVLVEGDYFTLLDCPTRLLRAEMERDGLWYGPLEEAPAK